ncbi:MAG TPA: hypothetical protein VL727_09520 [Puia sp.]|nr:hypothetical protein [Puia sp.]
MSRRRSRMDAGSFAPPFTGAFAAPFTSADIQNSARFRFYLTSKFIQ